MKKLSIITICYNDLKVQETCESIVNQSWQDFEWIVIDGGSNSDIQKIFDKYKNRIDKFVSEKDTGVYNAYNKGIKLSTGEYLNFMNAGDCFYYNDALKDVFENKTRTASILYGNDNYKFDDPYKNHVETMPKTLTKEFFFRTTIRHQSSFIKRDLFEKYGLYNENYKIVSDYEKWLVFFNNGESFENLPYIITDYDMNGISHDKKNYSLPKTERNAVINEYFTKEEIKEYENKIQPQYKPMEQIFSIKNSSTRTYKIITILGIHIKIRRSK